MLGAPRRDNASVAEDARNQPAHHAAGAALSAEGCDFPQANGAGEDRLLDSRFIAGVQQRQSQVTRAHLVILLQRSARA